MYTHSVHWLNLNLYADTYIENEKCIRMGVLWINNNIFIDAKNITEEIEFKK